MSVKTTSIYIREDRRAIEPVGKFCTRLIPYNCKKFIVKGRRKPNKLLKKAKDS